jgi:hypothetical protein
VARYPFHSPKGINPKNIVTGRPGRLSSWILGDENGQASEALANNFPADNADNRFHGRLYRSTTVIGQEPG